ncbi:DNA repair protein SWI5 homolog [Haemaphysalis longicornis]
MSETPKSSETTRNKLKMTSRRSRPSLSAAHRPFSSPMKAVLGSSGGDLQCRLAELRHRSRQLDEEIRQLRDQGCRVEDLAWHMKRLHTYNHIKDIAHQVIGTLATLEGVTIRDKQAHYGLPMAEPSPSGPPRD